VIEAIASPWPPYALLVILTAIARLVCENWFAPAAFVGLIWSFFTGASLLVVQYPVPGRGMWMLVLMVVAIQFGALVVHHLQPQSDPDARPPNSCELDALIVQCRRVGLVCTGIALGGCVYFLFTSLEEFGLQWSWIGMLEVGARWTLLRYDDVLEPWSVRLLVMWLHPAALLGGILVAYSSRRRDRLIGMATLLPALAYGFLTGARAAILLGLTCWLSGYVALLCICNRGRLHLFSRKRISSLLLSATAIVVMFLTIDGIRDSRWYQGFVIDFRAQKLATYLFGSPAAFAGWYAHAVDVPATWGARTFAGEFDLLRIKNRTIGTYTATSNVTSGSDATNVFTIFRGMIEDFTPYGAVLLAPVIGGLVSWIFTAHQMRVTSRLLCLSAFYGATLVSPLSSLFGFNGAMLAWVVAWLVFHKAKRCLPVFSRPLRAQQVTDL